jgi:hypothetical protein
LNLLLRIVEWDGNWLALWVVLGACVVFFAIAFKPKGWLFWVLAQIPTAWLFWFFWYEWRLDPDRYWSNEGPLPGCFFLTGTYLIVVAASKNNH